MTSGSTRGSWKMKVHSLEEALVEVRRRYPFARAEGSTFDWSFFVGDAIVAEMKTNRRSKRSVWELVIFDEPKKEAWCDSE